MTFICDSPRQERGLAADKGRSMSPPRERRKSARQRAKSAQEVQIGLYEDGVLQSVNPAEVVDYSDWGIRINNAEPLDVGRLVSIRELRRGNGAEDPHCSAHVVHCSKQPSGRFRIGLVFQGSPEDSSWPAAEEPEEADPSLDLYELLQISPKADSETIQRVYRLLAQRYHPDNRETGDEELFKRVLQAYRILSNPAARGAYDAEYQTTRKHRWKIFDQPKAAQGVEGEKRKRWGILSLLYTKKAREPQKTGLSLREMEDLLDCPKEHLEFPLWYLLESGLVTRGDGARYEITVQGVNEAEKEQGWKPRGRKLLDAAERMGGEPEDASPAYEFAQAAERWNEQVR